ncbi:MAG: DUF4397 domain-containing protein [Cyclobacteriaceae bacterium]|nr:DUF4397 domain-containing protein [Cyclobacteriaceae bacterium]
MKKYIKRINISIVAIAVAFLSVACSEEHDFSPTLVVSKGAKIKLFNAAPDAKKVIFNFNGNLATRADSLGYFSVYPTTNYFSWQPGSIDINTKDWLSELAVSNLSIQDNGYYTIGLTGVSGNYELAIINDDISSLSMEGKVYLRIANFIHDTPVSIYMEVENSSGSIQTLSNVAFKNASTFLAVEPDVYKRIQIFNSVDDSSLGTASLSERTLTANSIYTFYGRGSTSGSSLDRMLNR